MLQLLALYSNTNDVGYDMIIPMPRTLSSVTLYRYCFTKYFARDENTLEYIAKYVARTRVANLPWVAM